MRRRGRLLFDARPRLGPVRAGDKKVKAVARAREGFYDVPPARRK